MSHENETDHEFRTRMAAEGRAIYCPGKSVEEVKARLGLKHDPLAKLREDAAEADLTLSLVSNALLFLSRAAEYECGSMSSILELLSRATSEEGAPHASRLFYALEALEPFEKEKAHADQS